MNETNTILVPEWPHKLTRQDCFDRAWEWAKAHEPCVADNNGKVTCAYRNDDKTNACLIGCIIPDSSYAENMEGRGIDIVLAIFTELKILFEENVCSAFLSSLQGCHDRYALGTYSTRQMYEENLRDFAKSYDLIVR